VHTTLNHSTISVGTQEGLTRFTKPTKNNPLK